MVIVTNRSKKMANLTLQNLGIEYYFKDIIGGDDADCLKPSACPLHKALQRCVATKDKSMIVGDTDRDIRSGKNAGILTCGVTYGIGRREDIEKAKPDYIIDDLLALKEMVQ